MTRIAAAFTALALVAANAGCASMRAKKARAERLQAELDAVRYTQPIDRVWDEARRVLADREFPLASEDAKAIGQKEMPLAERVFSPARATHAIGENVGFLQQLGIGQRSSDEKGLELDTGWGDGSPRERRHLEAIEEPDGIRVVMTRIVEDPHDRRETFSRDLDAELELARRLEPATAERIQAAIDAMKK